ncbi:hypothetical protein EKM05_09055 [Flavobacterium sp. GSP27]|uniref:hypothetical protein n=1 Tax=Flavobacterium sp. GSP27 TaxID=2497489 RepID=UPI000F844965|nr:hypothetical protein [Flavobacterium sp. GSP27]RTZ08975.1 hypothetical protein EKM05_09055 [Flavobacterium sp. GSP27]
MDSVKIQEEDRISKIPYIIDTSMGITALNIFSTNKKWHKLPLGECAEMSKMFSLVPDYKEAMEGICNNYSGVSRRRNTRKKIDARGKRN